MKCRPRAISHQAGDPIAAAKGSTITWGFQVFIFSFNRWWTARYEHVFWNLVSSCFFATGKSDEVLEEISSSVLQ